MEAGTSTGCDQENITNPKWFVLCSLCVFIVLFLLNGFFYDICFLCVFL
jgi:hypothetical protein